jgi:hypothetical protein
VPEFIDQKRSGISLNLSEGLTVLSPSSHKAWNERDAAQQMFAKLNAAQAALASALTKAGLGVGEYPVPHGGIVVDFPPGSDAALVQYGRFDPSLDGVYLQVGSRPVASTMQWIRQGRPDELGNKAASAVPAQTPK